MPAAELEQTGENIKKISHLKKDSEGSPYLNQFMFGKRLLSLVPSESQNVSAFGLRLEIFLHVITLDHANPLSQCQIVPGRAGAEASREKKPCTND